MDNVESRSSDKSKEAGHLWPTPYFHCGGSAWESNPPTPLLRGYTGFEVRESHQCPFHFHIKK
ncbi:hypothetical protein DFAR_3990008 [Desulfarculales bacterium]